MSTELNLVTASDRKTDIKRRIGAALVLFAPIQYWILEAVSAGAWVKPHYSYFYNYISDLGVTRPNIDDEGRHLNSPLHDVAGTSFVALGLLTAIGFVIIATTMKRSGRQRAMGTLGVLSGLGSLVVASFPENTIFFVHAIGAYFSIWGGLALVVIAGTAASFLHLRRPTGIVLVVLGVFGFCASIALFVVPGLNLGVTERVSGYSYLLGMVIVGAGLLARKIPQRTKSQS